MNGLAWRSPRRREIMPSSFVLNFQSFRVSFLSLFNIILHVLFDLFSPLHCQSSNQTSHLFFFFLSAKSEPFRNWIKEQASFFAKRNYDDAATQELAQHGSKIEEFRQNDKPSKLEELKQLKVAYRAFEEKCGEDNVTFGFTAKKNREELEKTWSEMEDFENRRERDIKFRIEMLALKEKYACKF
jgi:hypothetical protein